MAQGRGSHWRPTVLRPATPGARPCSGLDQESRRGFARLLLGPGRLVPSRGADRPGAGTWDPGALRGGWRLPRANPEGVQLGGTGWDGSDSL